MKKHTLGRCQAQRCKTPGILEEVDKEREFVLRAVRPYHIGKLGPRPLHILKDLSSVGSGQCTRQAQTPKPNGDDFLVLAYSGFCVKG